MTCICVEPEECSECSKDTEISMLRAEIDHLRKLLKMAEDELIESDNHGRAQEKRADALEAEVEQLKEVLEQTAPDWIGDNLTEIAECLKECYSGFAIRLLRARKALENKHDN